MEWAEYGLDVVKVVIWPALIVAAAWWIGRESLRDFMRRLKKGSAFGATLELESQAAEAAQTAESAVGGSPSVPAKRAEVEKEPVATILDEWASLDALLSQIFGSPSTSRNMDALRKRGLRDERLANSIAQLRNVRNAVAHGSVAVTPEVAASFVSGVSTVRRRLIEVSAEMVAARARQQSGAQ